MSYKIWMIWLCPQPLVLGPGDPPNDPASPDVNVSMIKPQTNQLVGVRSSPASSAYFKDELVGRSYHRSCRIIL